MTYSGSGFTLPVYGRSWALANQGPAWSDTGGNYRNQDQTEPFDGPMPFFLFLFFQRRIIPKQHSCNSLLFTLEEEGFCRAPHLANSPQASRLPSRLSSLERSPCFSPLLLTNRYQSSALSRQQLGGWSGLILVVCSGSP